MICTRKIFNKTTATQIMLWPYISCSNNIYIYTATWIHPLDSDPTWKSQINFCPNFEWLFGPSSAGRSRRVGSVIHSWSLNSRFLVHAWLNHLIGTCVYTTKKNQAYVTNSFKSGCILWFRICALRLNGNRLCIIEEAETRATITGLSKTKTKRNHIPKTRHRIYKLSTT